MIFKLRGSFVGCIDGLWKSWQKGISVEFSGRHSVELASQPCGYRCVLGRSASAKLSAGVAQKWAY